MSLIEIKNLCKKYKDVTPLNGISVNIEEGEVVSVIGPSGAGKSTFLRCINRLETPTSGSIIVDGIDVCDPKTDLTEVRKKMGMVFQNFNLFGHKTVVENIMMPQQDILGKTPKEAYDEALKQLKVVGLEAKARSFPDELSGGQKQRVAIARALAMHPKIMLFDEPTSALDPTMVAEVLSVIRNLAGTGLTMIIVTHEMRLVRYVSSRVLFLEKGGIEEDGTPKQIFENSKSESTRRFVHSIRDYGYTLSLDNRDMFELSGGLDEFCKNQFMDRKTSMNCQLAVEEMVTSMFIPAIEKAGSGEVRLRVSAGDEGSELTIEVDYTSIMDKVDSFDDFSDELVMSILKKVVERIPSKKKGIAEFRVLK
ncbi:MAG: amino acid ABC transporter ATP-binding protein [Eubacterium sp.]|nr:amino acid ABC transporter ATP-binding protein [Eubacterium sp.]